MATRDLELELQGQFDRKADKDPPFRAVITDNVGNRTGTGSVWRNENRRQVWFQAWGSGSLSWALCERISPIIGLGVYVQFDSAIGQFEVLRDDPIQRGTGDAELPFQNTTEEHLARGGRNQLWIEPEMLQPLAVYPGSMLSVNAVSGDYFFRGERKTYAGKANFSIAASQPAGPNEHRLVGLYLDDSNTLQSVNGTVVATSATAAEPSWPTDAIRLAVVDLDDTQTDLSFADDITNRRVLWTKPILNKYDATAAPAVTDDSDSGYSKLSLWLDVANDNAYLLEDPGVGAANWLQINGGGGSSTITVKNTSGATANANDVGYIDEAGEYKTTTTASDVVEWCVVTTGGGNNANVEVVIGGNATVNYTGSAPSAGDYLVTSTTAGDAAGQTFVDAAIFAVCTAAGSGGTVAVLLLTQRKTFGLTSSNNAYELVSGSDSDWRTTINGAPSGTTVTYTAPLTSGAEDAIVPSGTNLIKMRLYNETRANYALISSVDTGANTITVTASADISTWADTDVITARSQTNTSIPISGTYFFDFELGDATVVPALAVGFITQFGRLLDSGAGGQFIIIHPWEANVASKRFVARTQVANVVNTPTMPLTPIINRRFCMAWDASGTGTMGIIMRLAEVIVAAP